MRMYGAGPGRWSGRGPQLQNLKKNEDNIPLTAIEAVRSGDRDRLRAFGNPLTVLGDIARAVVCAGPGNVLMAADFGAIESRSPGLARWRDLEARGLPRIRPQRTTEPSSPIGSSPRKCCIRRPADISKAERNTGKAGELACGFGGSVGAWRRIASDDQRSDEEIRADIHAWRQAHPKTTAYWRELARAIRIAIRTGQPLPPAGSWPDLQTATSTLMLPSGRQITYPQARLVPRASSRTAIRRAVQRQCARASGRITAGWFGTFVENVVQGTARDLLAAAIERFEARGIQIVLTVHDEVVAEVPAGSIRKRNSSPFCSSRPHGQPVCRSPAKSGAASHYLEPPEEQRRHPTVR